MSQQGSAFIERHEGFVSRAYRCPAGAITIGTGFTNRSATVVDHWLKTRGGKIRMGDTITRDESRQLLARCLREEYRPPVTAGLGRDAPQHAVDAGSSVSFNCGPKSLGWRWAQLYKSGQLRDAAERLKTTAVTARGRTLPGLVKRRREEANLLVSGDYGPSASTVEFGADSNAWTYAAQLRQDQELLNRIGYDCGKPDGLWGPKTKSAVTALQRAHGLTVDGILGPATRAKINRLANARRDTTATGTAGGGTAAGGAAGETATDPGIWTDLLMWGGLAVLAVGAAYLAWFYRDEIMSWLRRL